MVGVECEARRGGARVPPPRPDASRLLQAPAPRRNSYDSWPACCGRCTARTARSGAETARQRCGNRACACACCVSPGRAWEAEVGEALVSSTGRLSTLRRNQVSLGGVIRMLSPAGGAEVGGVRILGRA